MYIVIAGAGMVGGTLAEQLLKKNHDVVVIDQNKEICDKLYASTGVVAINGTVTSIDILKEAGIEKADVAVAATESDTDNLAFSILCKSFEVPQLIARIRNPNYERSYRVAGVNSLIRVTDILVHRMLMEIEHPNTQRIATISNNKAELFKVTVPERAEISGKTLAELAGQPVFTKKSKLIGLADVISGEFSLCYNECSIKPGDEIYVVSTEAEIDKVVEFLTEQFEERRTH